MIKTAYNSLIKLARTKHAKLVLALTSFFEAIVFPIPPDLILIPMSFANKNLSLLYSTIATASSVLGGTVGYLIGYLLWNEIGDHIISIYGNSNTLNDFSKFYNEYGYIMILIAGITPFPYKIVTIISGAMLLPFWSFVIFSIISRGLRFFSIGILILLFGKKIEDFIENNFHLILLGLLLVVLGGLTLKYYF